MACAVSSKSRGGIVDSVIDDVVVLQGTIELLWNDPIDPWLQGCRAHGAFMSQLAGGRAAAIPLVGEVVEYPRHGRGRRWRPSFVSMA